MSLQRALELAEDANHRAYPKPTVGAVVVSREGGRRRGRDRGRRPPRRSRRARRGGRACARRDALRDDGALRASRDHASLRRRDPRSRCRARRRRLARPESRSGRRSRAAARGRCGGRSRRLGGRTAPERGMAAVGELGPPVRDLQGGGHARRSCDSSRLPLGLGRGLPPARARAARRLGRGRRRHGDGPAREPTARCPRGAPL